MPVVNNYHVVEYAGNNSGRSFNFPFRCFSLEHLVVELVTIDDSTGEDVEVVKELVQNTEYSVSGGLDNDGGCITYPLLPEMPALAPEEKVRIYRDTPLSQDVEYPSYQQMIGNALDKAVMTHQEVAEGSEGAQEAIADFKVRMIASENSVAGAVSTANESLTTARLASGNASIAISTADEAHSTAEAAIDASSTAEENSGYAISKVNEAKGLAGDAVSAAGIAGESAQAALVNSESAVGTAEEALGKADTAVTESASAVAIVNSMHEDVDAARIASEDAAAAAQAAVAVAEGSTHGHVNKAALDEIGFNSTTGSFVVGGVEMAQSDLGNVDVSGFADTAGSNIDVVGYSSSLGLVGFADTAGSNIDVAGYSSSLGLDGFADTAGSNIDVAGYSSSLGLASLAGIDAGNIDVGLYKSALGPRVVTTLAGVTGNYSGEQILRVSGVSDDPEDDLYFWDGVMWCKEGV